MSSGQSSGLSLSFYESNRLYRGVYPGWRSGEEDDILPSDLHSYENAVGQEAAWVYFSNNSYRSRDFPTETTTWIIDEGAIPYIRLMLRSSAETDHVEPLFSLEAILSGDFDRDFKAWAKEAKEIG